jgi:hypothetical protein
MRRHRHTGSRSLFSIAGWLFADLLLALAVIFISANTLGASPVKAVKPAPPLPRTLTPQVTPVLELQFYRFKLDIAKPAMLLHGDPTALAQLKQQIIAEPRLQGRQAGLVIAYGGAPIPGQIGNARNIAKKVMKVLQSLQSDDYFVFAHTSYYDALYRLGYQPTLAVIDVYLFAK